VPPLLVLWDVDYTLVDAGGIGRRLFEMAFAQLIGGDFPGNVRSMAGRTDTAIALEVLTLAGVADPDGQVAALHALIAELAAGAAGQFAAQGRALPGAAEALAELAELARRSGEPRGVVPPGQQQSDGRLVQSVLTGNIPELAAAKLTALGLAAHLDLATGAYGDISRVRADLVPIARKKAADRYGHDFGGRATVLIGDTPADVEAAQASDARIVAVATGGFTRAELAAAGADVVLADLSDTREVLAAILG
jgi:phosphoglycolate phosphatase